LCGVALVGSAVVRLAVVGCRMGMVGVGWRRAWNLGEELRMERGGRGRVAIAVWRAAVGGWAWRRRAVRLELER
jgi:hypothetical protein